MAQHCCLFPSHTTMSYPAKKYWSSTGSILDPLLFLLGTLFLDKLIHFHCLNYHVFVDDSWIYVSRPDFSFQTCVPNCLLFSASSFKDTSVSAYSKPSSWSFSPDSPLENLPQLVPLALLFLSEWHYHPSINTSQEPVCLDTFLAFYI